MRTTIVALAAFAFAASGGAVASAAPGDCLVLGTPPAVVCEPYPPRPSDAPPVLGSRCTDLPPIGGLPRRECQQYVVATGANFGAAQIFTYDPPGCSCDPVVMAPAPAPRAPYRPVTTGNNDNDSAPLSRPSVARPAPRTPAAPAPTGEGPVVAPAPAEPVGCVPNAVRGFDGFDVALDPDHDGVSCERPSGMPVQASGAGDESELPLPLLAVVVVAAVALGAAVSRRPQKADR